MSYAKFERTDSEGYLLYDSVHMEIWRIVTWTFWKGQNWGDGKQINGFQGLGLRLRVDYKGEIFGTKETVLYLHCGDSDTAYVSV